MAYSVDDLISLPVEGFSAASLLHLTQLALVPSPFPA